MKLNNRIEQMLKDKNLKSDDINIIRNIVSQKSKSAPSAQIVRDTISKIKIMGVKR